MELSSLIEESDLEKPDFLSAIAGAIAITATMRELGMCLVGEKS
jgi:hypothetical protein